MSLLRKLRSKDLWNPFEKRGGYVLPHVLILCIVALVIFAIGFGSGFRAGTNYNASYWQTHYRFNGVKLPRSSVSAPIRDIRRPGLPAQVSIQISRYPAVANQGSLGACAAYASAWALSYEYRVAHNVWARVSPRYLYDVYSDKYSGGQDAGSWPDQLLENSATIGTPRYKAFFSPPFVIDNPPPVFPTGNLTIPLQMHVISGFAQGAGQGAVDGIRSALYGANGLNGHPVLIAFPVYPEYDNATQQPLVVSPTAGEVSRGGHENVVIQADDTKAMPDGTVGAVLVQNNWTKAWGASGRAWLSYDFVRRYSFGLEYITLGAQAPHSGPKPALRANPKAHLYTPPYDPGTRVGATSATAWYVHGVHLYNRSSGADISGAVNSAGDAYHVWPVAIAAVIGTESDFNPLAERWAGGLDNSCGLMQQIITNVYGRIGNVGARAACNWEEISANSITFGADILHQNDVYHGGRVTWPWAYGMYNAGPGLPDSYYYNMGGTAYQNFAYNFLPWYRYSLAVFAGGPAPTPKPKPKPAIVCGKRLSLRHVGDGRGGYWKAHLWYCDRLTWPRFHWKQKTVVTWKKR